jgi:peroxiredoxin
MLKKLFQSQHFLKNILLNYFMMLKAFIKVVFLLTGLLSCAVANKGYQIDVQVHGVQDTLSFLAYHYGNRQYIKDTVRVDHQGRFSFIGEEKLPAGIYMVVLPAQKYFEIIVDHNQHFSIETEMDNFSNAMKFQNSPDNVAFYNYMQFLGQQNETLAPARTELQNPDTNDSRKEQLREQLRVADEQVKSKQDELIKNNPDGLFSKILLAQREIPMPEARQKADGTPDHDFMYQYYKNNFWNNIDFSDDRLLRTPIFHSKLNQFFTNVLVQVPDSIIKEADRIMEKSRAHKEVFKYSLFFITNTFERSQIMGMDGVFVHMVENYYMSGEADWVSAEQLKKISERAMALKPILIGKTAPDINMFRPDGSRINLHSVNADYTILYFWDSECSHCKRQTPVLKNLHNSFKDKGVQVFAVNTEADRDKWLRYVETNNLNWINVHDPANRSGFRDKYDIWSTPLLFVLDKDKKIMAKKISIEQAEDLISRDLQRN